ncbi:GPP34 family phosphoprotein [Enemella dayhoffiae]|uniref:GPP34 family phosphoprotein n=1 Tax=Enemella dayhoffiae TaxID=2016507 RepID=A0A255GT74_9ACTN|nr:GPP34 family phosphoprotein [Enemella dayhoffiae]OYO18672.1 GPP34 family phosphoprotein [Enemella dayhoffiae]
MLIAEKLLLLLTADDTGKVKGQYADYGLAGAVLLDLALRGRVRLTEKGERGHWANRVVVVDDSPTDDALLDDALARLAGRDRFRQSSITRLHRHVRKPLQERLVGAGILRDVEQAVLGFIPVTRHPTVNPEPEQQVRAQLFRVLAENEAPDAETAALVGVLSALNLAHTMIGDEASGAAKRAVKARAKQLREENWAAEAAYKAIQAAQSAGASAGAAGG